MFVLHANGGETTRFIGVFSTIELLMAAINKECEDAHLTAQHGYTIGERKTYQNHPGKSSVAVFQESDAWWDMLFLIVEADINERVSMKI
jgi:hypothetical protein